MADLHIRLAGRAGRITLTRPQALNALSWDMCTALDATLHDWADNPAVALVVIDAEGDRAFCAGGDLESLYQAGRSGRHDIARQFWRDEYRLNARIALYPKPVVTLMQGYVFGGGVGLGCHAAHRVVAETSRLALPECALGLIPDIGGTHLLAGAPGRTGDWLGLTGARMGPGCAIHAGFADAFVPLADWPVLLADLQASGDATAVAARALAPPDSPLAEAASDIAATFDGAQLADLAGRIDGQACDWARRLGQALTGHAPLAMACTLEALRRQRASEGDILLALRQEYRFVHRAMAQGDFLEGIRVTLFDRGSVPRWRHPGPGAVAAHEVAAMLAPLGTRDWSMQEVTE